MYKGISTGIKKYALDATTHKWHKEDRVKSHFGMDDTCELIEGGFGLYSSANTKKKIGPVKTEYYRLGLVRSGSSICTNGLETFQLGRNFIVFGLPGQVLSLEILSDDYLAYYMYFSESFIAEMLLLTNYRGQFPFFNHSKGI